MIQRRDDAAKEAALKVARSMVAAALTAPKAHGVDDVDAVIIALYSSDGIGVNYLTTGMLDGISYVYPAAGVGQYSEIHSYIKKQFSGKGYTAEAARIVVLNGSGEDGLANTEKNDLEDDEFTVSQTANAPKDLQNIEGVKVYQINKKMKKTASALKKRYNVKITTKIPESLGQYDCDFVIILGKGYSTNN